MSPVEMSPVGRRSVELSLVVVAFDMADQLANTVESLARQEGLGPGRIELILVDNGSNPGVDDALTAAFGGESRVLKIEDAGVSPASGVNRGIAASTGRHVGLIVDGARMASPGLCGWALRGLNLASRCVVTAPAFLLGADGADGAAGGAGGGGADGAAGGGGADGDRRGTTGRGGTPAARTPDADAELLDRIDWRSDPRRLFGASRLAPSSGRGLFGPMGESSSLFMARELWDELGGVDEGFASPGGGLMNHDLYLRACALPESELVVLLGEGTFHQAHGGVASSAPGDARSAFKAEYERLRGRSHRPPTRAPVYLGTVPREFLVHVEHSLERAASKVRYDPMPVVAAPLPSEAQR